MAAPDACPVNHKSRQAWLEQARAAEPSSRPATASPSPLPSQQSPPPPHTPATWSSRLASLLWSSSPLPAATTPSPRSKGGLDTHRVVSSIPRSVDAGSPSPTATTTTTTAAGNGGGSAGEVAAKNHEMESGADAESGNWMYPSEKMFFDAMRRKGYDARVADMKTVVPIHNAVNERAWKQIREWEAPYLANSQCDGPKLESFSNKNDRLTPTARFNTLLGFTAPFDRHDWLIDRCGTKVEYVIDFYTGRPPDPGSAASSLGPSFYLDVRPKLNSWEGVRMRLRRFVGLV